VVICLIDMFVPRFCAVRRERTIPPPDQRLSTAFL